MSSDSIPVLEPSPSDAFMRGAQRPERAHTPPTDHPTRTEDRQLVAGLLARHPPAWSEFIRRYERLIVSSVVSTCHQTGIEPATDLVEECGAEVMATLFHGDMTGLRKFQGRSKLSTWLSVVVRRTTLNILRRRQRDARSGRQPDSRFDMAMIPARAGSRRVGDSDEHARLNECLPKLSETDRLVLTLAYAQKLTYAEIGRILGISENAVGPKLHRAQARLRKLMKRG